MWRFLHTRSLQAGRPRGTTRSSHQRDSIRPPESARRASFYTHFPFCPPALIHHSSVISHKAMGGSRSQARLWLPVDDSLEGEGEQERILSPQPLCYICSAPTFSSPTLKFSSQARPPSLLSPATYICFPSTRKRNYRPGCRSPERQPEVGSKHMQRKRQIEQLLDLSHNHVMLPPTFLLFPFSPLSLPGTLGW